MGFTSGARMRTALTARCTCGCGTANRLPSRRPSAAGGFRRVPGAGQAGCTLRPARGGRPGQPPVLPRARGAGGHSAAADFRAAVGRRDHADRRPARGLRGQVAGGEAVRAARDAGAVGHRRPGRGGEARRRPAAARQGGGSGHQITDLPVQPGDFVATSVEPGVQRARREPDATRPVTTPHPAPATRPPGTPRRRRRRSRTAPRSGPTRSRS